MTLQNEHLAAKFIRELEEYLNAQLHNSGAASVAAQSLPDLSVNDNGVGPSACFEQ